MKKRALWVLTTLLLASGTLWGWSSYLAPTRVVFVNYPDFQLSRIDQAREGPWVRLRALASDELARAGRPHAVFIFGRGLDLDAEGLERLERAGRRGAAIYVEGATNPRMDVTNLQGEALDRVTAYLRNGGTTNYRRLLQYARSELDGKRLFARTALPADAVPTDAFFHLDEATTFASAGDLEAHLRARGSYREGAPRIALLTSVPGPFNATRDHLDLIIETLEARGLNVFPLIGAGRRLQLLQQVEPDLVVYMPHGRLAAAGADAMRDWLIGSGVPVMSPISVFQTHDAWLEDPQGMAGNMLTMNVVLPELDGAVAPFAVLAQFEDAAGYRAFDLIPGRLDLFVEQIERRLALRSKDISEKRVAIYYFKGPGMSALTAAGLEVVPSLYRLLTEMRQAGYRVEGLPATVEAFEAMIQRQGSVLAPYAEGLIDTFLREGRPALIDSETYLEWVRAALPAALFQEVEARYGRAPGRYLSTAVDGRPHLAVARLEFGNVAIIPQPLPAADGEQFRLVHGAGVAPPHPYIGAYLWGRFGFEADAFIHFGTHGSLEFTPGKQVALSDDDWAHVLIGPVPHHYLYTVANVGEGIIAKRRSYATTVTHLTPGFDEGGLADELSRLEARLTTFASLDEAPLKVEYRRTLSAEARELDLYQALRIEPDRDLTDDEFVRLTALVEEINHEQIPLGLYTLGDPYLDERIVSTVRAQAVLPLARALAELAEVNGRVGAGEADDPVRFNRLFRDPAVRVVERVLASPAVAAAEVRGLLSEEDRARARVWNEANPPLTDADVIRALSGGAGPGARGPGGPAAPGGDDARAQAEAVLIELFAVPEKRDFASSLRSESHFRMVSGVLDSDVAASARRIARAIPRMADAIEIAGEADVRELLLLMQDEGVRAHVRVLLDDPAFAGRAALERQRIGEEMLGRCLQEDRVEVLARSAGYAANGSPADGGGGIRGRDRAGAVRDLDALTFYLRNREACSSVLREHTDLEFRRVLLEDRIAEIDAVESRLAGAVSRIEEAVGSIGERRRALAASPALELKAMLEALDGGFVAPTPGGDPLRNPATVPTGRNLFSIDAERTPSAEAWAVGVDLAESILESHLERHGRYPRKVSFTLWPGDFIQTEGATLAQVFHLLGVEPVRDPFGRVTDVRLVPAEELGRPRIDVVVQTAGQLRDLAASRLYLIDRAVALAAAAPRPAAAPENYVREGVETSERFLKERGLSPRQAQELAGARVFGGIGGNYGTNIMGLVESGDRWDDEAQVAETYLNNMGAMYRSEGEWGAFAEGAFEAALLNTEVVVHPRESNTWGPLSLDHVYEFMGGLTLAVRSVTGSDPDGYFADYRNPGRARVQELTEAIWVEAQSTLLNPKYIESFLDGGSSSAGLFAETFRNTYGWNVMKPDAIDDALWDRLHEVYVEDGLELGLHDFFERTSPWALQEMTAVMLETVRKGYWDASPEQVQSTAALHTALVKAHGAGCSDFLCDNASLQEFIAGQVEPEAGEAYRVALDRALAAPAGEPGLAGLTLEGERLTGSDERRMPLPGASLMWVAVLSVLLLGAVGLVVRRRREGGPWTDS